MFRVVKDKEIKFIGTSDECFRYILKHQPMSVAFALEHNGWKIEPSELFKHH